MLGDQRSRQGAREIIFMLVNGPGFQRRINVVGNIFFLQVQTINFRRSRPQRALFDLLKIIALADVGNKSDRLVSFVLQPWNDTGRI